MASPARVPILLGLLLLAPMAAGQENLTALRIDVEPFLGNIMPLKGTGETNITLDAPCVAAGSDPTKSRLDLWLTGWPTWSTVVISPSTIEVDPMTCQNGRTTHRATLTATATEQAPAFAPSAFQVHAAWADANPNMTAETDIEVAASYFSILDVAVDKAIQTVKPGEQATFMVKVTNLGNGDTTVNFELLSASPGLTAVPPAPIVLQSKQTGGTATSADVAFVIQTTASGAYTNEADSISYRIWSHYAGDEKITGDQTVTSFLLSTKGFSAAMPAPGLLSLLSLLAVVALLAARRAR